MNDEKEWHFTIIAICNDCGDQFFKDAYPDCYYSAKIEDMEKKGRMSPYSRVNGEFRFECVRCGRMLKVKTEEIKEKWEK